MNTSEINNELMINNNSTSIELDHSLNYDFQSQTVVNNEPNVMSSISISNKNEEEDTEPKFLYEKTIYGQLKRKNTEDNKKNKDDTIDEVSEEVKIDLAFTKFLLENGFTYDKQYSSWINKNKMNIYDYVHYKFKNYNWFRRNYYIDTAENVVKRDFNINVDKKTYTYFDKKKGDLVEKPFLYNKDDGKYIVNYSFGEEKENIDCLTHKDIFGGKPTFSNYNSPTTGLKTTLDIEEEKESEKDEVENEGLKMSDIFFDDDGLNESTLTYFNIKHHCDIPDSTGISPKEKMDRIKAGGFTKPSIKNYLNVLLDKSGLTPKEILGENIDNDELCKRFNITEKTFTTKPVPTKRNINTNLDPNINHTSIPHETIVKSNII
jgi:hypothetical protein